MTHWHDTPLFLEVRDKLVGRHLTRGGEKASHVCPHFLRIRDGEPAFFMKTPSGKETWFLCRECCTANIELELLTLDQPPAIDA